LVTVLLFVAPVMAQDCELPLTLRSVTPSHDATDVVLDARILVSFIGQGTADEFEVDLLDSAEVSVPHARTSWCYDHEGPYEVHCWWSLKPESSLASESMYQVQIDATEAHPEPLPARQISRFETGTSLASPPPASPTFEVTAAWTVDESDREACDYALPRRYFLAAESPDADPDAVYQIYAVDPEDSASTSLVHTVSVWPGSSPSPPPCEPGGIKQYLDGSLPYSDCFTIHVESGAGLASESTLACWESDTGEPELDTSAPEDTGTPKDTGTPTDPNEEEPNEGAGGEEDTGKGDTATGNQRVGRTPEKSSGCGCGTVGAARPAQRHWIALCLALFWRGRRRQCSTGPGPTLR